MNNGTSMLWCYVCAVYVCLCGVCLCLCVLLVHNPSVILWPYLGCNYLMECKIKFSLRSNILYLQSCSLLKVSTSSLKHLSNLKNTKIKRKFMNRLKYFSTNQLVESLKQQLPTATTVAIWNYNSSSVKLIPCISLIFHF